MSVLTRIARGGPGRPRSKEEERRERPPKKPKCCPTCAGNLCICPAEAPRRADLQDDVGVIPTWRAAERWVPAHHRDLFWPVAPIPRRPLFTAAGGVPPGLIRVPPPPQPPAWWRAIPTAVVNTMAEGGAWRPVEVPQRRLLLPQGVDAGATEPSRKSEQPLFEAPLITPSIESVGSSTGCNHLDDAESAGDSGPYLDLDLKL